MDNLFVSPSQVTPQPSAEGILTSWIPAHFSRGTVLFVEDLLTTGLPEYRLRNTLAEMAAKGTLIVRVARGMYCYPRLAEGTFHALLPPPGEIAESLARRWRVRIAPCGETAAVLSGLIPGTGSPFTWVSDGSEQYFRLQGGREIRFLKRKSAKVFSFRSEEMRNLVEGMRYIGRESMEDSQWVRVSEILCGVSPEDFRHDVRLAPGWIREELVSLAGGPSGPWRGEER